MSACLDDRKIAAMVAGTLRDEERDGAAAHLDACDTCRDLVAEAALAVTADDAPGYRLGAEVARGAMGRVISARDLRLGREVAIKQLIDVSPALRRRFEREVTLTAGLQHPGIVPVYQAGVLASGEPFYAMRRVHGRALDVVIAEATTPAARLALLPRFLAAAEAVAYAHSEGVIHRDLKPQNILVGDFGEVVVIDWGLAKKLGEPEPATEAEAEAAAEADVERAGALTRVGAILGTPAYMAPEQAAGEDADERADVYALGAVLYHLLAGAAPRAGATVTKALDDARVGRVVPIRERAPEVPPDLAAIVERAMAAEPGARYADAGALANDARTFLAGKLVAAHAYTWRQLLKRWVRRHRAWVAAASVVVVALLVIGGASFLRVRAERDRARSQQAASETLVGFMLDELRPPLERVGKLDLLEGAGREVDAYYGALESSAIAPGRAGLLRWGSALLLLGDVGFDRGDLDGAHAHYDRARRVWQRAEAAGGDVEAARRKLATAHDRLGDVHRERNDTAAATAAFERGLAIREALATPDHRGIGVSRLKLGDLARLAGDYARARELYRGSRDAFLAADAERAAGSPAPPEPSNELTVVTARLALVQTDLGQHAEAATAYAEHLALARARADAQPDDPSRIRTLAMAQNYMAGAQSDAGDFDAAMASYQASRDLHARLAELDPDNAVWRASLATSWGHIGSTALALDRDADAVDAFARELALWEPLAAADRSNAEWQDSLAMAHYHVGLGEHRLGRFAACAAAMRRAIAIVREQGAPSAETAEQLAAYYDILSDAERDRGDHAASLAAVDTALALVRDWKAKAPGAAWISREADLLWGRSRTERAMGDRAAARRSLTAARAGYVELGTLATLTAMESAMLTQVEQDLAALAP